MANYIITINNKIVAEVKGTEAAWEVYSSLQQFAELTGAICKLIDDDTLDVIIATAEDEEE